VSGSWSPSGDIWLTMSAGNAGATGTGAYTIATLWRPAAGSGGIVSLRTASGEVRAFHEFGGHLFGADDFTAGFGAPNIGTWYVAAQTKPAGSAHYRYHLWPYASDGTGTMQHGETASPANHGDGSTVTEIRLGWSSGVRGDGLIAVVGLWDTELSDGQLDTLKGGSLAAWAALNPDELISLESWNGSTGCTAVTGTSSLSSITGTVGVGSNPPSFDFSPVSAPTVLTAGLSGPALGASVSGPILTAS